jgi:hypothetical protein
VKICSLVDAYSSLTKPHKGQMSIMYTREVGVGVRLAVNSQSTSSSWYRAPLWGPWPDFYPYSFFGDNCFVVLPVVRPLWWEDGPVTYSAIADWSGHWGPTTIHYRLIWDCVPSSSPLMTRRDYGELFSPASTRGRVRSFYYIIYRNSVCTSQEPHYVILTRLYTGKSEIFLLYHI